VQPGEAIAIIGGSGCGKSTLLRLIAGLEQPSRGEIRFEGDRVTAPHPAVGFIFQEPRLLPWLSVLDNVAFGLEGMAAAEKRRRARAVLARVGLAGQEDRWPKQLSGGMAQRAALARGLVPDPRLMLLDEPFSALDALTRADLQDHLAELFARGRQSLVFVTHDIEEALLLGDRVFVLRPRPGRIDACIDVRLPRPRHRDSQAFEQAKRVLRTALDRSLSDGDPARHPSLHSVPPAIAVA
jgi:sulfonate transport system ATP-binding protein